MAKGESDMRAVAAAYRNHFNSAVDNDHFSSLHFTSLRSMLIDKWLTGLLNDRQITPVTQRNNLNQKLNTRLSLCQSVFTRTHHWPQHWPAQSNSHHLLHLHRLSNLNWCMLQHPSTYKSHYGVLFIHWHCFFLFNSSIRISGRIKIEPQLFSDLTLSLSLSFSSVSISGHWSNYVWTVSVTSSSALLLPLLANTKKPAVCRLFLFYVCLFWRIWLTVQHSPFNLKNCSLEATKLQRKWRQWARFCERFNIKSSLQLKKTVWGKKCGNRKNFFKLAHALLSAGN